MPGRGDRSWSAGSPADRRVGPGVTWFRTSLRLDLPEGHDAALTLRFGGGTGRHRALIFVNGWNMGQYVGGGVQRDFTLPAGVLRHDGGNTLALAVVAEEESTVGPVSLAPVAVHRGGVKVRAVPAPGAGG
ncbi:beta galactosidase jelly roll domain-containing protein [Thermomonospora cellulosilytica]|uniref:beta galactosidase jelly roll domain-containing protein n=1 Tax=Thermomonospora cellulosilytica TaxID=1411118 RepID=UPI0035E462E9